MEQCSPIRTVRITRATWLPALNEQQPLVFIYWKSILMLRDLPAMHKTWIQCQIYYEGGWCLKENKEKEKTRITEIQCVGTHLRNHVAKYQRCLSMIFYHLYGLTILVPLLFLTHRKNKGGVSNTASQTITKGNANSSDPLHIVLLPANNDTPYLTQLPYSISTPRGVQKQPLPGFRPSPFTWITLYNSLPASSLSLWHAAHEAIGEGRKEAKNIASVEDSMMLGKGFQQTSHVWVPYRQAGNFNCLLVEVDCGFV